MGEIVKWLLPPLLGGIIGYFTNWIAIKMLFRPLRPKYLGSKQLPFTPGVIPARKLELAGKIGETVALYLINEQELKRVLKEPRVEETLADLLEEGFSGLLNTDQSLAQMLTLYTDISPERVVGFSADILSDLIINQLKDPLITEYIEDLIQRAIDYCCKHELQAEQLSLLVEKIIDFLSALDKDEVQKGKFEQVLDRLLVKLGEKLNANQMTLRDILGNDTEKIIDKISIIAEPHLTEVASSFLRQEALADQLTVKMQAWLVRQPLLSMIANIVSTNRLEGLIHSLLNDASLFLEQEEQRALIGEQLKNWLATSMDDPFHLWLERLGEEQTQGISRQFKRMLVHNLAREDGRAWLRQILLALSDKLQGRSISSLINLFELEDNFQQLPAFFLASLKTQLGRSEFKLHLKKELLALISHLMQQPVRKTVGQIAIPHGAYGTLSALLLDAVSGQAAQLLTTLDIALMVRRKLEEFPIEDMERLVLDIAGHELTAITNLGGLLGALIGLVQLLFVIP